eukprot:5477587-Prymnesium_polylepis.1
MGGALEPPVRSATSSAIDDAASVSVGPYDGKEPDDGTTEPEISEADSAAARRARDLAMRPSHASSCASSSASSCASRRRLAASRSDVCASSSSARASCRRAASCARSSSSTRRCGSSSDAS